MARDFPDVRFYGVDIGACPRSPPAAACPDAGWRADHRASAVPIATRYPPRNVQFEMHDIKESFRFDSASIDFVHARMISLAVCLPPVTRQRSRR